MVRMERPQAATDVVLPLAKSTTGSIMSLTKQPERFGVETIKMEVNRMFLAK